MVTEISGVSVSITPRLVDGFEVARELRTVVHPVLNKSMPDVTLRAPGSRSGAFRMLFEDQASALTAYAQLSVPQVFTISDDEMPAVYMRFVVADGDLEMNLDDETRSVWWLVVPFVEVDYSSYSPPIYPSAGLFPGGS